MKPKLNPQTQCAQGGRRADRDSAVVPPIQYSATFAAVDADDFAAMASQPRHSRYYTRYGNPLHEQLAAQLVELEGGESGNTADDHDALVTASGMGAISLVLLGLLKAGDHVIAQTKQRRRLFEETPCFHASDQRIGYQFGCRLATDCHPNEEKGLRIDDRKPLSERKSALPFEIK